MKKIWKLAGIAVSAHFTYPYLEKQCRLYETDEKPTLEVIVSDQDISLERERNTDGMTYSDGYYESLAFYRKLVTALLDENVLLLHGSAIRYRGKGYIYTAPSGTGKSTHTRLCREVFGDDVSYINDDKPLLRCIDGIWYVYGTPWDGKHHNSENIRVMLGGICKLVRGEENSIQGISCDDAICVLLSQIYRPDDSINMKKVLSLIMSLAKVPFWQLECNISCEAARLSLGTMGGNNEA